MNKCNVCNKAITKRSPGITCSRCDVLVHERAECSGLNNKQRAALRAAETLEWVCNDCHLSSTRKTSFVSAVDDDEEDDEQESTKAPPGIDLKKLYDSITKEVHKIVIRELEALTKAAQHASDKMDEYDQEIKATTEKIKILERKQTALKNQNTHLETRLAAIEQRLELLDQAALTNNIEIAGIQNHENENELDLVRKVASLLQIAGDINSQIKTAKRLPARKGKTANILVQLNSEDTRHQWVSAGRNTQLLAGSVLPDLTGEAREERVYVREALTGRLKFLLAKAKSELKATDKFKYVWCKYFKVFARKSDSSKIHWIRSEKDIESLSSSS